MIIDTHLHYGNLGLFSLDYSMLQKKMKEEGIHKGIISTVNCCEYQSDADELMPEQIPQLVANQELLEAVKQSNGRLYISFWCKPALERNTEEVYHFIKDNKEYVKGLKFHPYYSRIPLEDNRYDAYIDIARQLRLPISVHTSADRLSNPGQLLAMAKRFPDVSFIMVHMGLYTDNELAIECVAQADNLYGDTTWVSMEKILKAIKVCGREKMMFGSDAPIDGDKSYDFYQALLTEYKNHRTEDLEYLMYENAKRIFNI